MPSKNNDTSPIMTKIVLILSLLLLVTGCTHPVPPASTQDGAGKVGLQVTVIAENPSRYREKTTAVGSFMPNDWGLYDMHGNVLEWCTDWYDENYYANGKNTDPQGPASGSQRVQRGGAWVGDYNHCRSAARNQYTPNGRGHAVGFRIVVELK